MRPVPAAGELIRVTPDSGVPFTGRLTALGGDTLVLSPGGADTAVMVFATRQRVEVHRRHREGWSGLGALAGVALGVAASQLQSGAGGSVHRAETAVVGGAAGAVVGGFLGFLVAPHRWQPLRLVQRGAPAHPRAPGALPASAAASCDVPAEAPAPPATAESSAAPSPADPPPSPTQAQPAPVLPSSPPADARPATPPPAPPRG